MKIKIYQSFYKPEQFASLDKAFIPYNNLKNLNPQLSEYPLIIDLYSKNFNYDGYWGMMSWRFNEKTNISGSKFIDLISANPGYDVYHYNPFHGAKLSYNNPFTHGEDHHPGMVNFINRLLLLMGYNIDIKLENFAEDHFVFCSYYVGNQRFWENWMSFQDSAMTIANNDQQLNTYLYHTLTNYRDKSIINFSFVIERLVNLFLHLYSKQFLVKGFNKFTLS